MHSVGEDDTHGLFGFVFFMFFNSTTWKIYITIRNTDLNNTNYLDYINYNKLCILLLPDFICTVIYFYGQSRTIFSSIFNNKNIFLRKQLLPFIRKKQFCSLPLLYLMINHNTCHIILHSLFSFSSFGTSTQKRL